MIATKQFNYENVELPKLHLSYPFAFLLLLAIYDRLLGVRLANSHITFYLINVKLTQRASKSIIVGVSVYIVFQAKPNKLLRIVWNLQVDAKKVDIWSLRWLWPQHRFSLAPEEMSTLH